MKIVKHGCVIQFDCPVCSCEFLMSEDEEGCRQQTDKDRKGDDVQYLAVCPDCGEGDVPGYKKQYGDLPVMAEERKEEVKEKNSELEKGITFTKEDKEPI